MSSTSRLRRRHALLVSAVIIAAVLGLAELWLRVEYNRYAWKPPVAGDYESYPYTDPLQHPRSYRDIARMSYDPFLGYIPTAGGHDLGYRTNGQHLRYDEDLQTPKGEREIRIFVTGGSTAWGAGVRQDQTYARLLEERFAAQAELEGFRVQVIPAGVGAYVTTQERIFLFNHLLDYEPDAIVMFSGANDVYAGYRGDHLLKNQDFMNIRGALAASASRRIDPGVNPARLAKKDPPRWADHRIKLLHRMKLTIHNVRHPYLKTPVYETLGSYPPSTTVEETLRNVHAVLAAARRHDFHFMFYLQPYLVVTAKPLSDWERLLIEQSERETPSWPKHVREAYPVFRSRLAEDARRERYRFVDGDDAIKNTNEAVFVDDFHLGDRGNRLVADHLYGELIEFVLARTAIAEG